MKKMYGLKDKKYMKKKFKLIIIMFKHLIINI